MSKKENAGQEEPAKIKYKECAECYKKIDARAKVCPYCRKRQPNKEAAKAAVALGCIWTLYFVLKFIFSITGNSASPPDAKETAEQQFKSVCVSVVYDNFKNSDNCLDGEFVHVSGTVAKILDLGTVMIVSGTGNAENNEGIALKVNVNEGSGIHENDYLDIYGISIGYNKYDGVDIPTVMPYYSNINTSK